MLNGDLKLDLPLMKGLALMSIVILISLYVDNYVYLVFTLIGGIGALIANSTGVGGGVVFVPVFSALNLEVEEIIGTSLMIQSFGMTFGAYHWMKRIKHEFNGNINEISKIVVVVFSGSILGMLIIGQSINNSFGSSLVIFKIVSIIFLVLLIINIVLKNNLFNVERHDGIRMLILMFFIGIVGGSMTLSVSIGIGELVAIILIMTGYNVYLSISAAVILSSLTVIPSAIFYVNNNYVLWNVVLFAVPGALIGARFSSSFAYYFGPVRIKYLIAAWVGLTVIFM